jgi:hypothetical protein
MIGGFINGKVESMAKIPRCFGRKGWQRYSKHANP